MSEYGRMWERIRAIRDEIRKVCPMVVTNSLVEAEVSVEEVKRRLDRLLADWEDLNRQAERVDD